MKSTLMAVLLTTGLTVGCSPAHTVRTSTTGGNFGNARCSLSEKQLGKRRNQIARLFEQGVLETRELPDGFAFRFASDDALTARLFELVQAERQCCGFLTFELTLEPKPGPVWLRLRGDSDAKRLIREMIDRIGLDVRTSGLSVPSYDRFTGKE